MTVLYLNLAVVFIFSFMSRYFAKTVPLGPDFVKPYKVPVIFALASLVLVSGLRVNIGDTYFYMFSYARSDYTFENIRGQKDIGFNIFQMLLQSISHNPQFMIFVIALLTNLLIVLVLYKYSRLIELSLYVYITSGLYLTSMNGIRQFLAAAIVFCATKYLFAGNWKKYMLTILLAAPIHLTAIILIPIYFIVRRKAWTKVTLVLIGLTILLVFGFNQFTSALFTVIGNSQYGDYQNVEQHGANILRLVPIAMPILVAYLGRERLRGLFPNSDYVVNMSLVSLVFMIIATQNWIFARFNFYFGLYNLILISWIIKLFAVKVQKFIYYLIIVFYFIYFYYEHVISLGVIYKSDILHF